MRRLAKEKSLFLSLQLQDLRKQPVSSIIYWLPDAQGTYSGLQSLGKAPLQVITKYTAQGQLTMSLINPAIALVAFLNRLALVNPQTQKRILPVFYSDIYVSILPGECKTVVPDYPSSADEAIPLVSVAC